MMTCRQSDGASARDSERAGRPKLTWGEDFGRDLGFEARSGLVGLRAVADVINRVRSRP